MSNTKLYKSDLLNGCVRFGDLQIIYLQGTTSSGSEKRINFPYPFLDRNYVVTITGNYGSELNIANKYADCIFLNIKGSGSYNTGKYELIAIGRWK